MQKRSQSKQSFKRRHQSTRAHSTRASSTTNHFASRLFGTVKFCRTSNLFHLQSETEASIQVKDSDLRGISEWSSFDLGKLQSLKCAVQRCMCRVNLCVELATCDCFFSLRRNYKCNDLQLPYPQFCFSCQRIGSLEAKQKRGDWSLPQ